MNPCRRHNGGNLPSLRHAMRPDGWLGSNLGMGLVCASMSPLRVSLTIVFVHRLADALAPCRQRGQFRCVHLCVAVNFHVQIRSRAVGRYFNGEPTDRSTV